jgi:DivIVA domain-containing protein
MALTPEEIESREFLVAIRGYDKDDVHAFLRQVAAHYREVVDGHAPVDPFGELGDEVASIVKAATDEANALKARVHEEAIRTLEAAEAELQAANELRSDAARDAEEIMARARADGERSAEDIRGHAAREAEGLRSNAHREADEMRARASAEAERLGADARRAADEMQAAAAAEAERLRHEARQDAEQVRSAYSRERDQILAAARSEADAMLAEARRQSERFEAVKRDVVNLLEATESLLKEARDEFTDVGPLWGDVDADVSPFDGAGTLDERAPID